MFLSNGPLKRLTTPIVFEDCKRAGNNLSIISEGLVPGTPNECRVLELFNATEYGVQSRDIKMIETLN